MLGQLEYELVGAISEGDAQRCVEAIAAGAAVNANSDASGLFVVPMLVLAAQIGDLEVVRVLVDAGASLEARAPNEESALHVAILNSMAPVVQFLLERGADPDARATVGDRPLHFAASSGSAEICDLLARAGADINAKRGGFTRVGASPLHTAVHFGQIEVVRKLVERGASLESRDADDQTPAMEAAKRGWLEILQLLRHAGADLSAHGMLGYSALHLALENHCSDVAKYLIDEVGVQVGDLRRVTPLHVAAKNSSSDLVLRILDKGARVAARLKDRNDTALHCAAQADRVENCRVLIERGADITYLAGSPGREQLTPFQSAVRSGALNAISFFVLEVGENLSQRTIEGQTLVELAGEGSDAANLLMALETQMAVADALGRASMPIAKRAPSGHQPPI